MRGGQRFPGTFLGDQRGHFPNEGQFARPHFPRDMGMRPQEMRLVEFDSIDFTQLYIVQTFLYAQGLYPYSAVYLYNWLAEFIAPLENINLILINYVKHARNVE